jgi:hypothetical protein
METAFAKRGQPLWNSLALSGDRDVVGVIFSVATGLPGR